MKSQTKVYVGMDVHKDSVTIAVLPEGARERGVVGRSSSVRTGFLVSPTLAEDL